MYDADFERRNRLRSFLMDCRSRLMPTELGLPQTSRRRTQGLRRSEVAELIGVSLNWYSLFESGREIRVSPGFVSRLASALRLEPHEERTLFSLAIFEIYRLWVVSSS